MAAGPDAPQEDECPFCRGSFPGQAYIARVPPRAPGKRQAELDLRCPACLRPIEMAADDGENEDDVEIDEE